jgi:hypothetical protein
MTRAELDILLRSVVATVLLATATTANATLYRWVDERGHVTYSNEPPPTGARVREVITLEEDRAPTASEMRTRQILEEAERDRRQSEGGFSTEGMPGPVYVYGIPDSPTPDGAATDLVSRPDAAAAYGTTGAAGARTNAATRDPCLLSADPRCYQLNARSYDPYNGYTPNSMESPAPAVGATADASGTAATGTSVTTVRSTRPVLSAPRLTGLPPGTPVQPLTRARSATIRD